MEHKRRIHRLYQTELFVNSGVGEVDMPYMPRARKYQYIGDMSRVTPCELNGKRNAPACDDGSCPGRVDGKCRFHSGELLENARSFFILYQGGYRLISIQELVW